MALFETLVSNRGLFGFVQSDIKIKGVCVALIKTKVSIRGTDEPFTKKKLDRVGRIDNRPSIY